MIENINNSTNRSSPLYWRGARGEVKIKVCGMRDSANIQDLAVLKPNFMGFIFYEKSKRYAANHLDINILNQIPAIIKKVGVFVNESEENILIIVEKYKLNYVQLHGEESVEFCKNLRLNNIKIIKAFSVDEQFDFEEVKPYVSLADYFLFDTKTPLKGGSGQTFDWSVLEKYHGPTPFLLAGGIDETNFEDALALKNKFLIGLDLNSKFEIEPGLKDIEKLKSTLNS